MKNVELSKEELRTIIWALQNEYARSAQTIRKSGKNASKSDLLKRISAVSGKLNGILTRN